MSRKRKAQINLEFLASAGFYLIALGAVLTAGSEVLPQYSQSADRTSLNLEARSLTNQLVSEKVLIHTTGAEPTGNRVEKLYKILLL